MSRYFIAGVENVGKQMKFIKTEHFTDAYSMNSLQFGRYVH